MPYHDVRSIEPHIDFISKLLSLAFKIGVLLGGACLLFYCYRLQYFPVGLSVGDAFLLILLATSFGIVYGVFVISLTALGLWWTPILRPVLNLLVAVRQRLSKRRLKEPPELAQPGLNAFIFGILGLVFIGAIYRVEPSSIWKLSATSFLLGALFATYRKTSSKLNEVVKAETGTVISAANHARTAHHDKERLITARMISLGVIFVTPLLVGGVSGILLEGAMRFANIRKGPSYVMLRSPYSAFIPSQLQAKQSKHIQEHTTFEGIDVVFSGLGKNSVIEFKDDGKTHRLEIPNESILVVPL